MIELWQIFLAFLIPGIVGYGGGPATIPLIEHEVVDKYHFLTTAEFGEVFALGNALPGPIATKMAGYIGYYVSGVPGAIVAILATVVPSLIAMILLLGLITKYKDSPRVKRMTALIRPTIAILLLVLAIQFFVKSFDSTGSLQTVFLIVVSYLLLERWKIHPAFVIMGALGYGAVVLS